MWRAARQLIGEFAYLHFRADLNRHLAASNSQTSGTHFRTLPLWRMLVRGKERRLKVWARAQTEAPRGSRHHGGGRRPLP
jgi:hypothetical protein